MRLSDHRWCDQAMLAWGEVHAETELKPGMLSSGSQSRPANAEPSQPVANLATAPVTESAMRRGASNRAARVSPENFGSSVVPRASLGLKAAALPTDTGQGREAPGGVVGCGTVEQDGPVTWETLVSPRGNTGDVGSRRPDPSPQRACGRARGGEKNERPPPGRRQARGTGAEADGDEGVGEPNMSDDAGKRVAPKPAEQRGLVLDANFRRDRCPSRNRRRTFSQRDC